MVSLLTLFGCTKFDDGTDLNTKTSTINNLEVVEGTLQISSKAALKSMVASYQKNVASQNKFNDGIRTLQNKGFKPLTPMLDINDTEKIQAFITRKKERLQKMYKSVGITAKTASNEIDLDDELIADPALAGLLNEDREIVVADSLYKYTETGLYFCLKKDKQKLYDYLNKLTITQKQSIVGILAPAPSNCNQFPLTAKSVIVAPVTLVSNGINLFLPIDPCIPTPTPPSPVVVVPPAPTPAFIKQNLPICSIETQGFFERIFGTREVDTEGYSDEHRVKVTFWNQNFFIFSSIGCSAKFQKPVKILGTIIFWDKSYADQIELGINNINYDYKFNVPQYNNSIYATQGSVFYSYKGVNYNQFGVVVPELPANSGFPFNTSTNQNVVEMYIHTLGYDINYNLSATAANQIVDGGLKSLVNMLPFSNPAKSELANGINTGTLKYNVLKAVPFDNKVSISTMGARWTNNNDNAITQYFDFNFLLTWKSSYSSASTYLTGLNGATPYTLTSADLYGATLHNGEWKGRRLIFKQ